MVGFELSDLKKKQNNNTAKPTSEFLRESQPSLLTTKITVCNHPDTLLTSRLTSPGSAVHDAAHHSELHVEPISYFLSTVFNPIVIYICLCLDSCMRCKRRSLC